MGGFRENVGDLICGPKRVREVLRLYGKEDEDIIRLVREIQWPEVRKGATLKDVADALEKRGIHTYAMKISPSARIVWSRPVIVHINPAPGEMIGHYVVWLPESKDRDVIFWNTDGKVQKQNESIWSKERSGAVLLTSSEQIDSPDKALKWVGFPFYGDFGLFLTWGVLLLGVGMTVKSFRFCEFLYPLFKKGDVL